MTFGDPRVLMRAKAVCRSSTAIGDYIRWGGIPVAGSGDVTSDSNVDLEDYFYFQECASNGGPGIGAGPGCVWADMDRDGDVDCHDFAFFQPASAVPE